MQVMLELIIIITTILGFAYFFKKRVLRGQNSDLPRQDWRKGVRLMKGEVNADGTWTMNKHFPINLDKRSVVISDCGNPVIIQE